MSEPVIRLAEASDLDAVVALHAADDKGGHGDTTDPSARPAYEAAFRAIAASDSHALFVAELDGEVVGTFLLSMMPGITARGAIRAVLRAVQVREDRRSGGIGARMVAAAEAEARRRGAPVLELTSNLSRPDAHRFYERLGYARTHAGFKKKLSPP